MKAKRISRRAFLRGLGGAAALVTTAGLAACAQPVPGTQTEGVEPAPVEEAITIRYQEKAPVQEWTERLVIPVFEEQNPGIDVVFEPRVEGWIEKNLTMMAAGTAPEIIHTWGEIFQRYSSKGQMLDLTPFIEADYSAEDLADQHEAQWEAFFDPFRKVRFALARQLDMQFLYYNKDLFDQQGAPYPTNEWTYDDWATASAQLVVRDDAGNIKSWGTHSWLDSWTFLSTHINAFGGHIRDEETWMQCRLSEPEAKAWFEWARARIFDDESWLNGTMIQGIGASGDSVGMFASGLFAVAEINLNSIGQVSEQVQFNWDITHPPIGPGGRFGLGDNDGFGIYQGVADRGGEFVDACWKFVKFMNGPDFQRVNMEQTGELPGRKSLAQDYETIVRENFPGTQNVNLGSVAQAFELGYTVPGENFRYQAEAYPIVEAARQRLWEVGDASADILDQVCEEVNAAQMKAYEADPDK